MEEKIKSYVEGVFRDVPKSERAENIKSEILQNLTDKYRDLKREGRDDEEAYAIAISSGGDLSGIVADLKGENVKYSYAYEKQFEKMYDKQYKREKKKMRGVLFLPVASYDLYLLFDQLPYPRDLGHIVGDFYPRGSNQQSVCFLCIQEQSEKKKSGTEKRCMDRHRSAVSDSQLYHGAVGYYMADLHSRNRGIEPSARHFRQE